MREHVLADMLLNQDYDANMLFTFHDKVFLAIDWTKEPDVAIDALYKQRAQQLRNQYDYLILQFSGGADSTQILKTFLKNDIFIDEIQVHAHIKAMNAVGKQTLLADGDLHWFLEYEYSAVPQLHQVEKLSPKTKITIIDPSDFLHEQLYESGLTKNKTVQLVKTDNNDLRFTNVSQKLTSSIAFTIFTMSNYHNTVNRNHSKRSGIIRGLEKPSLCFYNNGENLGFHFNDIVMLTAGLYEKNQVNDNLQIENFYWSPNAPLIPVKQSHMLKKAMETNKELYILFSKAHQRLSIRGGQNSEFGYDPAIEIERLYSDIIYPDWNSNRSFVAPKPTKINPEFKIWQIISGDHYVDKLFLESRNFTDQQYSKISNKKQIHNTLFSRVYNLGKLDFKWIQ